LVAGARNHHYLRSQESHGVEAVGLAQVQLIAEVGKRLEGLFRVVA
jgi:hypothetical protein